MAYYIVSYGAQRALDVYPDEMAGADEITHSLYLAEFALLAGMLVHRL